MSTYRGAATLITSSGTEIKVGADLQTRGADWGGLLTIDGENWNAVKNETSGRIRLSTGVEGEFLRPNPAELPPPSPSLPFRIQIVGNGDAPF